MDYRIVDILRSFPSISLPPRYQDTPKYNVMHYIETTGKPHNDRCRRLRPDILNKVHTEFRSLVSSGVCRKSKSEWASPIIINGKNSMRIVDDYRKLNDKTIPDRYPLPNIYDCTARLKNCTVFSNIDLVRARFNIPIFPDHVCKIAVISPAGLFDYLCMPFGLKYAPATFMRFIITFLDDMMIELNLSRTCRSRRLFIA